ncbi:cobyrinic acid ac-diamide synthase, partial [Endozoicomonas sp. SM1973]|nr:cobyrinic acid ac-diamide synthase [Spartinivicinus marinus]
LKDYPEIELLSTVVGDRKAYRDAMSDGVGVVEMSNSKAKAEIQLLAQEIF